MLSFLFQAKTTASNLKEPFWNEILQVPIHVLPSFATIKIECSEPNDKTFHEAAQFEVLATDCIRSELGEEWLVATPSSSHSTVKSEPSLFISCSLDRDLVAKRQLGLWPLIKRGDMFIAAPKHTVLQAPQEPEMPLMNTVYPSATPRPAIAAIDIASDINTTPFASHHRCQHPFPGSAHRLREIATSPLSPGLQTADVTMR